MRIFGKLFLTLAISAAFPAFAERHQDNYTAQNLLVNEMVAADPAKYPKDPFDAFPLEHDNTTDAVQDNRFLGEFFYMLLMLGLLIGVVLAAGYFLRRLTASRIEALNTSSRIKIQEARSLSQRSHIYIIEVDETEYLVAENHAAISLTPIKSPCVDTDESV